MRLPALLLIVALASCGGGTAPSPSEQQLQSRVAQLETEQRQLEASVAQLRQSVDAMAGSSGKWVLWRMTTTNNGWALKPLAEDAFADKSTCLTSANSRAESAGGKLIGSEPVTGRFSDRTDRFYCLPPDISPLSQH